MIASIAKIEDQKRIAILDTSTVSFMQHLNQRCPSADSILKDYDLILIPNWVMKEISDSELSISYVENLEAKGYPIFQIEEKGYSSLVDHQEWNLFQIVKASANQLGQIQGYLRKHVETDDPLDMAEFEVWIEQLYNEWPINGKMLSSGRFKKKNAGEVSITILVEILSWYYEETDSITIYSQDNDTKAFASSAQEYLRKVFSSKIPIPVTYKSNDAILCQLYRNGAVTEELIRNERKNGRKITYSKVMDDNSVALVTEMLDAEAFIKLVKDASAHIVF